MIIHDPWVGRHYKEGIRGQRIFIVGYSHHDDSDDHNKITINIVKRVINHTYKIAFFENIKNYFGFDRHEDFWDRVVFFNYIPNLIGASKDRFKSATPEQIEMAKNRYLRLITKYRPDKVFVFSKKAWWAFPYTREESDRPPPNIDPRKFPGLQWGTYVVKRHIVTALGLRHPQWADSKSMKSVVHYALNNRLTDSGA